MGKKYIIELLDDCQSEFKGIMAFGLTQEKQISVELIPEESLIPYTEPDLEQVRKEAYEQGYHAGYVKYLNKSYEDGLKDAWEAARKVSHCALWDDYRTDTGKLSVYTGDVLDYYTASEAIEKIRQYEQIQEEIKAGDEVIAAFGKAVVTGVGPVHFEYVYADGSHGYDKVKNVTKTGRHFPELVEILKKMEADE